MNFDAVIEARMSSKRLPGKILLKVQNKTMIEFLIERLKKIKKIKRIFIATTNNPKDNVLEELSKKLNLTCFRGSEKNVLKRVVSVSKKFKIINLIRVTSDCPIIDYSIIDRMIRIYETKKYDCVSNSFIRSYPDGMDVNICNHLALKKSLSSTKNLRHLEHVTSYIGENPSKFKIKHYIAKGKYRWPKLSLTLDEKADFVLIKKIIDYFYKEKNYFFKCGDVIDLLKFEKKNWIKINNDVKRKGYNKDLL